MEKPIKKSNKEAKPNKDDESSQDKKEDDNNTSFTSSSDKRRGKDEYRSLLFVIIRILIISCGSFSYGYSWTIYNQLFHVVKLQYGWSPEYEDWINGAINSVFIFSAVLGCLFLSFFQNFKRLTFFMVIDVVAIGGSLLCFTTNTYLFFIGRTVQGFVAGCNSVFIAMYLKEFVPKQLYSELSVMSPLGIVSGQVSSFLVGGPIDYISWPNYWRFCLLPTIVAPLLRLVILGILRPLDTPGYYIMNDQEDQAKLSISQVYKEEYVEEQFKIEFSAARTVEFQEIDDIESGMVDLLKKPEHRRIVLVGIYIFFCQQFAGINAVNFYSSLVFQDLGSKEMSNVLTGIWGIMDFVSLLASLLWVVKSFGRRKLFSAGSIIVGIMLILFGVLSQTDYAIFAVQALFCYILCFNFTMAPIPWTLIAEQTHSKLINLCIASHWVCAFIIAQFFPLVIEEKNLGLGGTFYAMGLLTMVNGVVFWCLAKETKGLTKKEIYKLYGQKEIGKFDSGSRSL